MSTQTIQLIFLLVPLFIGGIIAALNTDSINDITENAESWIRKKHLESSHSAKWLARYFSNPLLWVTCRFCDWTDGLTHRGLKNGIRVTAVLYLIIVWCFIVYVLVRLAIFIAIMGALLYVIFKMLFHSSEDTPTEPEVKYQPKKRVLGVSDPGQRVNPKTGRIQEEGFLGWEDTERRVNPDNGKVQDMGFITWENSGTRIDQDSGKIQTEGFIGYEDTGERINPETGIIQKEGLIGWENTDERMDPKTGKRQRMGLIGWEDTDA